MSWGNVSIGSTCAKTADCKFDPGNRPLYKLTHLLKIQAFFNTIRLIFMIAIALCITGIFVLEHPKPTPVIDFFKGFCVGISLASSVLMIMLAPYFNRVNRKVKAAIKDLYTCN